MRRFLVTVQVILIVAGLGVGGFVGYRSIDLIGKDDAAIELQANLVIAVLALMLVVAAGVVRPRHDVGAGEPPGSLGMSGPPQRMAPNPPPFQQPLGGYRPGGPSTGQQPPIGPGGPHTGPQPKLGQDQPFGGRTEQFPR